MMSSDKRAIDNVNFDDTKPEKRTKVAQPLLIRCLVPNKIAGGVIGKGGENIKNLRQISPMASIEVKSTPDCPNPEERVIQVDCGHDDIEPIFSQLIPLIDEGLSQFNNSNEPELCVLFSGNCMGSIIGKGGSNINEFRTKSSVFVKAFPQKLQNSDERVLLIKGQKENIIQCMKMLFETVEQDHKPYKMFNPADGMVYPRDQNAGGYQEASGEPQFYKNKQNQHSNNNNKPPSDYTSGTGGWGQFQRASNGPYMDYNSGGYPGQMQQQNDQGQNFGGNSQGGGMDGSAQEAALCSAGSLLGKFVCKYPFTQYHGMDPEVPGVKEVTLENHLAGSIIGDKGARIKEVRGASGAKIKIGDFDSACQGERLIVIEGTNVQCHLAEYMLQCCVQAFGNYQDPARAPSAMPATPRRKLATPGAVGNNNVQNNPATAAYNPAESSSW